MKRGRPKGESRDPRSFGPLGDLIRNYRMQQKLGLLDVAKACGCSVQFISNIEHGRAPLPWDKTEGLAKALGIPLAELQAANLAVRADFKSFMGKGNSRANTSKKASLVVKKSSTALRGLKDAASLVALTADDPALREVILKYQEASQAAKKRFHQQAKRLLANEKE